VGWIPIPALTTTTTQCHCRHQLLCSKKPAIAGPPRHRSCDDDDKRSDEKTQTAPPTAAVSICSRGGSLSQPRRRRRCNVVVVISSCARRSPQLRVFPDAGAVSRRETARVYPYSLTRGSRTRQLRVQVGTGTLKSTRGLPMQKPKCQKITYKNILSFG